MADRFWRRSPPRWSRVARCAVAVAEDRVGSNGFDRLHRASVRSLPMWRALSLGLLTLVLVASGSPGCGMRTATTDPYYICVNSDGQDGASGEGDEVRAGSCEAPWDLSFGASVERQGTLSGCSDASGWCGYDGGAEDVYRFSVPAATDVSIRFDPDRTDFIPVVRVVRVPAGDDATEACKAEEDDTDACLYLAGQSPAGISWYAEPEHTYYVFVDSPSGSRGDYVFEMRAGRDQVSDRCLQGAIPVDLGANPHLEHMGVLPGANGFADGHCDSPGAEQVFELSLPRAGRLTAVLEYAEFWSALSLRPDCSGGNEIVCVKEERVNEFEPLERSFGVATKIYLAVDQQRVGGGDYKLVVDFE